jgi:ferric-dicitrate binding protein FerR (iron transport regulator)
MPGSDRLKDLLELFLSNRITPQQLQELKAAMDDPAFTEGLDNVLKDSYYHHADTRQDSLGDAVLYLQALKKRMQPAGLPPETQHPGRPPEKRPAIRRLLIRLSAAAVFILAIGATIYTATKKTGPASGAASASHFGGDVKPGGNKAILTLGDQSTITLDESPDGQLASQGGARILKDGNALRYDAAGGAANAAGSSNAAVYNTVTTPAGGQYQLVLADGTAVWLDSKSSIRYPTNFNGSSREVTVTGQVYLEVAARPNKPFRVKVGPQVVEVIGTKFNINAFDNEPGIKTTLADGAVNIHLGNSELLLHPAEQAAVDEKGNLRLVAHPDMEETLAWKDGVFHFSGTDIAVIMRQITRWYNVDIEYKDPIPGAFVADIPRNVPLSQVLQLLELTGHVHFKIEGKKIIVSGTKR